MQLDGCVGPVLYCFFAMGPDPVANSRPLALNCAKGRKYLKKNSFS